MFNSIIRITTIATFLFLFQSTSSTQEIKFIKQEGYYVANIDTVRLIDYLIINNKIYWLTYEGSAHSNFNTIFKHSTFDKAEFFDYWPEFNFHKFPYYPRQGLARFISNCFSNTCKSDPKLTSGIIQIDDKLFISDEEDFSFQFDLNGKFLERVPGFSEFYELYLEDTRKKLIINNVEKTFPISIFGNLYSDCIYFDDLVMLFSNEIFTIVKLNDLRNNGSNASTVSVPINMNNYDIEFTFSEIYPIINNYFIHYSNFRTPSLFRIDDSLNVHQLEDVILPSQRYSSKVSIDYPYYYQVENPITFSQVIYRYKIEGLQKTSSITERTWESYN